MHRYFGLSLFTCVFVPDL